MLYGVKFGEDAVSGAAVATPVREGYLLAPPLDLDHVHRAIPQVLEERQIIGARLEPCEVGGPVERLQLQRDADLGELRLDDLGQAPVLTLLIVNQREGEVAPVHELF